MSLDDISVRIGIKDVGSLREARDMMNTVHTLSGGVIAAVEAASRGIDKVGAKLAAVEAGAPQLSGVINVFAQAFQQVVQQWKGLDAMASAEVSTMRSEITSVVEELKKATTELKGQFEALRNDPSLENLATRMSAIAIQSERVATMQGAIESMATARKGAEEGGGEAQPDITGAVTRAVSDVFSPALEELGRRIDAFAQAAGGVATMSVGAVNNAVGEIKRVLAATSNVDKSMDVAGIVMGIVSSLQGVMQAQQAVQSAPVSMRRSREDKRIEDQLGRVDLFFQSEWKLFSDRFGSTMDKVDEIFKNTDGLKERMEKLKDAVRDLMSSYRKGGGGGKKGETGEDGKSIEDDDKKPDAKASAGGNVSHKRGPAPKHGRKKVK